MKIILINSPKYGIKEVLVDDEDFEYLNNFKWSVMYSCKNFYAVRCLPRNKQKLKTIKMHREILNINNPNVLCDHIDHNGLNNQKINLRECSHSENNSNRTGYGISKYLGVSKNTFKRKNKNNTVIFSCWVAQIKGKKLGNFKTEIEAAEKYNEYAKIIHGEFANLNII